MILHTTALVESSLNFHHPKSYIHAYKMKNVSLKLDSWNTKLAQLFYVVRFVYFLTTNLTTKYEKNENVKQIYFSHLVVYNHNPNNILSTSDSLPSGSQMYISSFLTTGSLKLYEICCSKIKFMISLKINS